MPVLLRAQSPIALALDAVDFLWVTSGDTWFTGFIDPSFAHDGEDVCFTYSLGDNESHWLETTVPGPGDLDFWWRLSSANDINRLELDIDGVLQTNLVRNTDWQEVSLTFPAGTHTLRWTYYSGAPRSDDDAAYIDQVNLHITGPPYLNLTPQVFQGFSGSNYLLQAAALGGAPLHYQWFQDGVPIGGDSAPLEILNFSSSQAGTYSVIITNTYGALTSTVATISFFTDAVEATNLIWRTSGVALWFAQTNISHDGIDAAQSGYLEESEVERLSVLEVVLPGPGVLSFWYRLDVPTTDGALVYYIDYEYVTTVNQPTPWTQQSITIEGEGQHTFQWVFGIGGGPAAPDNQAFVDEVSFVPDPPRPRLEVVRSDSDITVFWPLEYTGYTLEATDTLTAAASWTNVTLTGANVATVPANGPQLFFRLRKP